MEPSVRPMTVILIAAPIFPLANPVQEMLMLVSPTAGKVTTLGAVAGSVVVEKIFRVPGLGKFFVQSAFNRDYTMILGTTVFLSTLIVLFNLLSDILAAWMNPRLRAQFGEN